MVGMVGWKRIRTVTTVVSIVIASVAVLRAHFAVKIVEIDHKHLWTVLNNSCVTVPVKNIQCKGHLGIRRTGLFEGDPKSINEHYAVPIKIVDIHPRTFYTVILIRCAMIH